MPFGRTNHGRGILPVPPSPTPQHTYGLPFNQHTAGEACQVCGRTNHTAFQCYHRFDLHFWPRNIPQVLPPQQQNARNPASSNQHAAFSHAFSNMSIASSNDNSWIIDSGAANHVTGDAGSFFSLIPYNGQGIFSGDGKTLPITHIGKAQVRTPSGSLILSNAFLVPKIKRNFIS